ncbi:MAG: neutral/alkaline non-lysosomal ceramidase N-terminal domain-containing protein [Cyclobacteriaceae bacterium]|nr:neutral/alkaline non-lysosomal ceramidase N-terminal domain-containing protein [Cyclobacteriaceae bacterium]
MQLLSKLKLVFLFLPLVSFAYGQSILKGNAKEMILTPPLEMKYTLGGYGARMSEPAEAIHDNIKAKALVLDNGTKKYAIVTMDILGFPPNVRPMIVKKLEGSGWTEENILLLPSHAHTSLEMFALNDKNIFGMPAIGIFQPELLEFVVDKLASLIEETDRNLKDVKVGTGQVVLEGLNRNRRGDEAVDKELTVTRVDLMNGQALAVLVNWTGHPTIMDENDMWVSGGWPGYLQRELEDWIDGDVVAMYYNGAEGDQSVIARGGGSHYEKAENYGRKMAKHALNVYEKISPSEKSDFVYNHNNINLPARTPHPTFMQTGGEEYQLDEQKIQALLEQVLPTGTHISALRVGDLLIVGAPGELIAELALDIKSELKKAGIPYPVIGGLANEWISYILTEDEYHQGGYETSASFYGPTLGEVIHDEMLKTAKELK